MVAGTVFDNFLNNINYKQSVAMTLGPEALTVTAPSSGSSLLLRLGRSVKVADPIQPPNSMRYP